ncbi:MAG: hypothetical protein ACRCXL_01250 [Dermatophilaceae bacterium]
MVARFGSVVVAASGCAVGYLLIFWTAGRVISGNVGFGGSDVATLAFVGSVGTLFLGIAMYATAWSSGGAFFLAAGHLAAGGIAVASPPGEPGTVLTSDVGRGAQVALVGGLVLTIGVVFLVAGLTTRESRRAGRTDGESRRAGRTDGGGRRVRRADRDEWGPLVSLGVAVVGVLPGLALVLAGGTENYQSQVLSRRGAALLPLALLVVGLVALALAIAYARWSVFGLGVVGVLVSGFGLAAQVRPAMFTDLATSIRPETLSHTLLAVRDQATLGFVTAIGGLLVATAFAVRATRSG